MELHPVAARDRHVNIHKAKSGSYFAHVPKRFIIADLIVSEVCTNLVHTKMGLRPFPRRQTLPGNESVASFGKKGFRCRYHPALSDLIV